MAYSKSLTEQRSASTLHSTIHPSQYGSEVALADLGESGKDGGVPALPSFEVSWDGDHDPKNPMNWSESRKMLSVCLVSAMGFLVPFSSSVSAPSTPQVMAEFNSSSDILSSFVVSIFVLGNAVGPMIFGPASELWGRNIVLNLCNLLFVGFTIGCALSTSIPMLLVFRFLAGCVGGAPIAVGGGTIADLIPRERRGKAMGIFSAGSLAGPVLGPVAGGFLAQALSWRWSFWLVVIISGAIALVVLICMRETHAPTILKAKTARLRKERNNPLLRAAGSLQESASQTFKRAIVRPFKMMTMSPITLSLALFQSLVFGYMYLMFTTYPQVFSQQYHFNTGITGLVYIGLGLGVAVGTLVVTMYSDKIMIAKAAKKGRASSPEDRLVLMIYGVPMVPIGLFWYGWSAQASLQFMVPIIGTFFLGLGTLSTSLPGNLYMVDTFTEYAASALAAVTFLRSITGGLLPLAGLPMFNALSVGWGCSVLAFISVAFCPIPILLTRYGSSIRARFPLQL